MPNTKRLPERVALIRVLPGLDEGGPPTMRGSTLYTEVRQRWRQNR